jgi:lysophospholipase L1-like esterase
MKRTLIALSVLMNVVVLLAVAWFLWGGGMRGLIRGFVGPGHERWVSQFEALEVTPGSVVFLGDSITEGGSWHELFPGVPVHNRGIGGDTTDGVLDRLHQVSSGAPAKVFLKIGTNDLSFGTSEDEIVASIGEIIDRLHAEAPGVEVHVQSVLPRAADYRERIESLNAELEPAVLEHGAHFVNLYPLFLAEDGSIRDEFANDELHLLGAGYEVWRDEIDEVVREGLEVTE